MWGISTLKQWRTTPPNHWQCRKLLLSQKWLEIKHRRRLAHIAQISLHSHEHLLDFRSESPCVSQLQEMSEMNSWFQGLLDEMSLAELKERLRIDPTSASCCCCCCSCCYLQYCYQNSKIREGDTFQAQYSVWDHGAIDSLMTHECGDGNYRTSLNRIAPGTMVVPKSRLDHLLRGWVTAWERTGHEAWKAANDSFDVAFEAFFLIVSNWKMVTLVFPTRPNSSITYTLTNHKNQPFPPAGNWQGRWKSKKSSRKRQEQWPNKGFQQDERNTREQHGTTINSTCVQAR